MSGTLQIKRRWLKSVIDAADQPLPQMPWARAAKPEAPGHAAEIRAVAHCARKPDIAAQRLSETLADSAGRGPSLNLREVLSQARIAAALGQRQDALYQG